MVSRSKKSIAITIFVIIIASWILISSINNLQPIQSGLNGPTSGPGSASTGTGTGNGISGSGGPGIGNVFNFPNLNFNFNFPSLNFGSLKLPNLPIFNIPFIHFHLPSFNLNFFGSHNSKQLQQNNQTGGSNSGAGQKSTSSNPINPLILNEFIILIIVGILSFVIAVWAPIACNPRVGRQSAQCGAADLDRSWGYSRVNFGRVACCAIASYGTFGR